MDWYLQQYVRENTAVNNTGDYRLLRNYRSPRQTGYFGLSKTVLPFFFQRRCPFFRLPKMVGYHRIPDNPAESFRYCSPAPYARSARNIQMGSRYRGRDVAYPGDQKFLRRRR